MPELPIDVEDGLVEVNVGTTQAERLSLPQAEGTKLLSDRYPTESKSQDYLDQVAALTALLPRQH